MSATMSIVMLSADNVGPRSLGVARIIAGVHTYRRGVILRFGNWNTNGGVSTEGLSPRDVVERRDRVPNFSIGIGCIINVPYISVHFLC